MPIKDKTKWEVIQRQHRRCEKCGAYCYECGDFHHVWAKSVYFNKDRDEAWNIVLLCRPCHDDVEFTAEGVKYDQEVLRPEALQRKKQSIQ